MTQFDFHFIDDSGTHSEPDASFTLNGTRYRTAFSRLRVDATVAHEGWVVDGGETNELEPVLISLILSSFARGPILSEMLK